MEPTLEQPGSTVRFEKVSVILQTQIHPNVFTATDIRGKTYVVKVGRARTNDEVLPALKEYLLQKTVSKNEHIVSTFGIVVDQKKERYYLLLEYCQSSLAQRLKDTGPFDLRGIVDAFQAICFAVNFMHAQTPTIIHRNLKVESVLETGGLLKVGNFKWATNAPFNSFNDELQLDKLRCDIEQMTLLKHRPPELIDLRREQEIGTKVDIWALGCILFRLCTGCEPFEGCMGGDILNVRYTWPEGVEVDSRLVDMVQFMLVADPARRPNIAFVLARLQHHFPEWVDKKWRVVRPHFFPMRQDGNHTLPVTKGKNLEPAARIGSRGARRRGRQGGEPTEKGGHLLEQSSSESLFSLQERKKNRMAMAMDGEDIAAALNSMARMDGKASTPVQPPITVQVSRGHASTLQPNGGTPKSRRKMHDGLTPEKRAGKHMRHRTRKAGSANLDVTIIDVNGDPEKDEAVANCAKANIEFMTKDPAVLIRQLRHLKEEDKLQHYLSMLMKSSEDVCCGFFFELVHEMRDPMRILRNIPQFSNEKAQRMWNSRKDFSQAFGMYEGNFSLRKFRKRNADNFPPVGNAPISVDAVVSLQQHLTNAIEFLRGTQGPQIALEIKMVYDAICSLTAQLLLGGVDTERIQTFIVPQINEHYRQAIELWRTSGIEFPDIPFDVSNLEQYVQTSYL